MWTVESVDGKWGLGGLGDGEVGGGDADFAVGPRGVAYLSPVGREV